MDALLGEKERVQFLVGTTSLQQPNQVRLAMDLSLHEDG